MKTVEAEVKSSRDKSGKVREDRKQVVVGKVQYSQYDTIDEATKALSEATALSLINTQVATNAKNAFRAEAVGSPSEKNLRGEAFARIATNAEYLGRLQSAAGDTIAVNALVDEVVTLLKKEKGLDNDDDDTTTPA